jgi:hypothetical protein
MLVLCVEISILRLAQQVRQLRHISSDPPLLILCVSSSAADLIGLSCPLLLLLSPKEALPGRKVMEWFKQKTSIAGYQISNWMIVLGAIIIVLLIFQNLH